MDDKIKSSELATQPIDYVTLAAKGVLGIVPFAGSLLAELAGTVIPNQRIERIAQFAKILDGKLAVLEQEFIRAQLTNENFSDLLEDGLRQASRSLTDERREYIVSLIANSLLSKDIEYIESKHILQILSEVNDIEIIWLRFYLVTSRDGDKEFREKHSKLLTPARAVMYDLSSAYDKEILQNSYKEHLSRLGLLEPKYKLDSKTQLPEFDRSALGTGSMKIRGYQITSLGKLLLKQIGLSESR